MFAGTCFLCKFLALNSKHQIYLKIVGLVALLAGCCKGEAIQLKRMEFVIVSTGLISFAGCNKCEKNISNKMRLRRHLSTAQHVCWHKLNQINRSNLLLGYWIDATSQDWRLFWILRTGVNQFGKACNFETKIYVMEHFG